MVHVSGNAGLLSVRKHFRVSFGFFVGLYGAEYLNISLHLLCVVLCGDELHGSFYKLRAVFVVLCAFQLEGPFYLRFLTCLFRFFIRGERDHLSDAG